LELSAKRCALIWEASLKKNNLAIITARGGSKRIPRKNIRLFLGKPILQYSIDAALHSTIFDEVMVSTDDEEIAEISRKSGAKVPFLRSAKNSNDISSTADVVREVLTTYESLGEEFTTFGCIYPTAPFVTAEKLRQAYYSLSNENVDAVVPVVRFSFPIQRALIIQDQKLSFREPRFTNSRSQDLDPTFHDCGQFYFGKVKSFMQHGKMFPERTAPLIIPESEAQDIDHEEDWLIAEMKYRLILEKLNK
jgi:pseudaminic acid cytidylyltransferase